MEGYTVDSYFNNEFHILSQDIRIRNNITKELVESNFNQLIYDIFLDPRFSNKSFNIKKEVPKYDYDKYKYNKRIIRYSVGINISYFFSKEEESNWIKCLSQIKIRIIDLIEKDNFISKEDKRILLKYNLFDFCIIDSSSSWTLCCGCVMFAVYVPIIVDNLKVFKNKIKADLFDKFNGILPREVLKIVEQYY